MKNKLNQTLSHFGAAFRIQISGSPATVARRVARLFNFGVITSIGEEYKEGVDHIANVQSYGARFESGLRSMARVNIRAALLKRGIRKPSSARALLSAEIAKLRGEFERVENITRASVRGDTFDTVSGFGNGGEE